MKKSCQIFTAIMAAGVLGSINPANVHAMSITAFDSATNMANSLTGSGITVTGATYTGATAASGYFTGGAAAGIGIESGIVLTTGYASNLNGTSNTSDSITGNNSGLGLSYLDALIPGYTTHDATDLTINFQFGDGSVGGSAYFNFVFGSDEYNEYVNTSFNDVFGFFLDGTAVSDNMALIPGTSTPVTIDTVNLGSNSSYYNSNDPSDFSPNPPPYAFEYDGFTDVITVSMLNLSSGTHTLHLSIADAGDWAYDSGVFIQGKSFADNPVEPVPEPASMLLFGTGIAGLAALKIRSKK